MVSNATNDRGRIAPIRDLLWVGAGGAIGTLLRFGVGGLLAPYAPPALATFTVNMVGAFLLAVLLTRLARATAGSRLLGVKYRVVRLGLGTGILGGFTTYSGLATDAVTLAVSSHTLAAVTYAVSTVVLGGALSFIGIIVAGGLGRRERSTP